MATKEELRRMAEQLGVIRFLDPDQAASRFLEVCAGLAYDDVNQLAEVCAELADAERAEEPEQ